MHLNDYGIYTQPSTEWEMVRQKWGFDIECFRVLDIYDVGVLTKIKKRFVVQYLQYGHDDFIDCGLPLMTISKAMDTIRKTYGYDGAIRFAIAG